VNILGPCVAKLLQDDKALDLISPGVDGSVTHTHTPTHIHFPKMKTRFITLILSPSRWRGVSRRRSSSRGTIRRMDTFIIISVLFFVCCVLGPSCVRAQDLNVYGVMYFPNGTTDERTATTQANKHCYEGEE
jgi:hypothetical protein